MQRDIGHAWPMILLLTFSSANTGLVYQRDPNGEVACVASEAESVSMRNTHAWKGYMVRGG